MSLHFARAFVGKEYSREDVRAFTTRPGGERDSQGKRIYFTEQQHKAACDINRIIERAEHGGVVPVGNQIDAFYGDVTGLDFREAMEMVNFISAKFMEFDPEVRAQFNNDPSALLEFYNDPANDQAAKARGLPRLRSWIEADVKREGDLVAERARLAAEAAAKAV